MDKMAVIYVTALNKGEAAKIGRALVAEKLAACVNIYGNVASVYKWKGKIAKGNEAVFFVKTRRTLVKKVRERIKELHSYSCPCMIELSVPSANKEYLKWIFDETKEGKK